MIQGETAIYVISHLITQPATVEKKRTMKYKTNSIRNMSHACDALKPTCVDLTSMVNNTIW